MFHGTESGIASRFRDRFPLGVEKIRLGLSVVRRSRRYYATKSPLPYYYVKKARIRPRLMRQTRVRFRHFQTLLRCYRPFNLRSRSQRGVAGSKGICMGGAKIKEGEWKVSITRKGKGPGQGQERAPTSGGVVPRSPDIPQPHMDDRASSEFAAPDH